jgi:hypothetical protein
MALAQSFFATSFQFGFRMPHKDKECPKKTFKTVVCLAFEALESVLDLPSRNNTSDTPDIVIRGTLK